MDVATELYLCFFRPVPVPTVGSIVINMNESSDDFNMLQYSLDYLSRLHIQSTILIVRKQIASFWEP